MSELIAALIGAIAAGIIQFIAGRFDQAVAKKATLAALAAEVRSICRLIRAQKYLEFAERTVREIESGLPPRVMVIDIRSNYFTVFEALATELGTLDPDSAELIVHFYGCCKTIVDSTRPDGVLTGGADRSESLEAAQGLCQLISATLLMGDRISKLHPESNHLAEPDAILKLIRQ